MKLTSLRPLVFVLALFALPAAAWAEDPPPVKFKIEEDIVYGNKDGLALTFDVLTPEEKPKGIGVVLVSSGGWKSSKSNIPGHDVTHRVKEHWVQGLLQGGYTVFIVRHGSAPRYFVPEMIDDVRRSVRFIRLNAKRYAIDPDHIGITSGSSGGHLSLMVATTGDDGNPESKDPVERVSCRTQAVVAWFPPTDLVNWGMPDGYQLMNKLRPELLPSLFEKVTDVEAQLKSISPIYFVTKDDPPLLLIHGKRDFTVPLQQSEVMKAKYEEVGLPVELIVHPKGGHSYWPGILDEYRNVQTFFDRNLAPEKK
ncbi:MAG TPA: alpha/beta hydrolase [Pirellulales bacterium]|jgi:acetyl esterase/lipase